MHALIDYAIPSDEMIKEVERLESLHERAKIIVERQTLRPRSQTFYRYLHILEPIGEDSAIVRPWEGIAGKVKQEVSSLEVALEQRIDRMQTEVLSKVHAQDTKLDDLMKMVAAMSTQRP